MIVCSVCHTENYHLAIVCKHCGGFLQTRVDTLDLFATMWNVIEKPKKTFYKIAVAQHKNYAYVLSSVAGIGMVFLIFWLIKAAEYTDSLINIITAAIVTGPPFGILVILLLSFIERLAMKAYKVHSNFRNIVAVNAYAVVPLVLSTVLFLAIKLMTFGTFFFSKNPSPVALKPVSYILLVGMDMLFVTWSALLLVIGMKILTNVSWIRAVSVTTMSLILVIVMIAAIFRIALLL